MRIEVNANGISLREAQNFSSFGIFLNSGRVPETVASNWLEGGTRDLGGQHVWVKEEALRAWGHLHEDAAWQERLTAMIDKAKGYGFIDESGRRIRAHIVNPGTTAPAVADGAASRELADDFKVAMRRLAATVSVITTRENDISFGITATAVSSFCAEPPALIVCINRSTSIHDPVRRTGRFCVNLLAAEQDEVCNAFSGKLKGEERFNVGSWVTGEHRLPYLETAQANIFCRVESSLQYGSHTAFVGAVEAIENAPDIRTLVYQNGTLGSFASRPAG